MSTTEASTALPAANVKQTLRVAVYVESNLTLPAYATGGIYTDYSANIISFLQGEGFAVTPLSTQDILNHELTTLNFDAFVLPNQLPRESIMNLVTDYWLAGGGILSFEGSIGFCFYAGLIDDSLTGDFWLDPPASPGYWAFSDIVYKAVVKDRHPITQAYDIDDEFVIAAGNTTIVNGVHLPAIVGPKMTNLVAWNQSTIIPIVATFEDPIKGGKIVQVPGNCSTIPVWERPIITDAIDWLAPRPKARILADLAHDPYFSIDSWDEGGSAYYADWRDAMVSNSYTVDKLHPSSSGNLTAANLNGYDMLFIPFPKLNFTSAEVTAVTGWVNSGGGLFCLGDRWYGSLIPHNQNLNYLLTNFDVSIFPTGDSGDPIDYYDEHLTTEDCSIFYDNAYGLVNFTGDAMGIWRTDDVNYVSAVDTHGAGRIVLFADLNWIADNHLAEDSHLQYAINVANWLTTATADVLLYVDNQDLATPYDAPAVDALNDLGIPFYLTYRDHYMNLSLHSQQWDLVILDSCWPGIHPYFDDFSSYLDTGGDLIVSWHMMNTYQDEPLYSKVGFEYSLNYPDEAPMHIWSPSHGIFNYPNNYGALNFTPGYDIGEEGDQMTVFSNATALAGITATNQPGNATIVYGFGGQVLWNGYLIDQLTADLDDSTLPDNFELWENEIAFMYYDRPTINSPDDVTYEEGTTGNEISWTPAAPAGPWEYVVRENGSIVESGQWAGGSITINVDGLNASITEYELTVFDTLGYSASDVVNLNVTKSAATGGLPIDLTTLLIIGAVLVVIIIIIIAVRRKK